MTKDLSSLAEALGRKLTSHERDLAERLVEAVRWWGRYSFPTKGFKEGAKGTHLDRDDRQTLMALLDELGVAESVQ